MLILRIRQAETALRDGRLDEACVLAMEEPVRGHRHGQRLITRLSEALRVRGEAHLAAGRPEEALADGRKAFQLAGQSEPIADLLRRATAAIDERERARRQTHQAVAAAKVCLDAGDLTRVQKMLEPLGGGAAAGIQDHAEQLGDEAARLLERARAAMGREDLGTAVKLACEARRRHASNSELHALCGDLIERGSRQVRGDLDAGRIDRAELLLSRLADLCGDNVELEEWRRFIAGCRKAWESVAAGRMREAAEHLRRLASARPSAGWLNAANEAAMRAAEASEELRGGPLGMLLTIPPAAMAAIEAKSPGRPANAPAPAAMAGGPADGILPARCVMQVDGAGGYLVLREPRITIGPARSSLPADVPLMADGRTPRITITRAEDDYFLEASQPVKVNGEEVTRRLLASGDRIDLGGRCRLRFELPNAASTTAVLHLSGTRLERGDVRKVLLVERDLVMGPGVTAHVRAPAMTAPLALHVRQGRLVPAAAVQVLADNAPRDPREGLPMNARLDVAGVSLVISAA